MKRSKKCPKCSSLRVGYLASQPDISDQSYSTRALGIERSVGFLGNPFDVFVGNLEAYVCTECGYHESYVVSPTALDWSKLTGLVMLNPPKPVEEGPYR